MNRESQTVNFHRPNGELMSRSSYWQGNRGGGVIPAQVATAHQGARRQRELSDKQIEQLEEAYITTINFSVLSAQEIVDRSATAGDGITSPVLGTDPGQINDAYMGTSSGNMGCRTCTRGRQTDPGHWGHIDFRNIGPLVEAKGDRPPRSARGETKAGLMFYNPLFMNYTIDMARIICHNCSQIRQSIETLISAGLLRESARQYDSTQRCERKVRGETKAAESVEEVEGEEYQDVEELDESERLSRTIRGVEDLDPENVDEDDDTEASAVEEVASEREEVSNREIRDEQAENYLSLVGNDEVLPTESLSSLSSHIHKIAEFIDGPKSGTNVCVHCQKEQSRINVSASRKAWEIIIGKKNEESATINIREIFRILDRVRRVNPATEKILQIVEPSRFIIQVLPVLPPRLRPAVGGPGDQPTANYISQLLSNLVAARQKIEKAKYPLSVWLGETYNDDFLRTYLDMRNIIHTIMDSSKTVNHVYSSPDRNIPTIIQKLVQKKGLIRGAMTAKRVVLTARAHAIHVEGLDFDQIAVSDVIAEELSKPEVVTSKRREKLQQLLRAGKIHNIVFKKDRKRNYIKSVSQKVRDEYNLRLGDLVFRPLETGDVVAAGRQPTIHKTSMMGYRVKIIPGLRGFGISLPVTMYHNADFDGDEITIHVPFSRRVEKQIESLMSPVNYILDAETNRPGIAQTFNALTAALHLTTREKPLAADIYRLLRDRLAEKIQTRNAERKEADEPQVKNQLSDIDHRLRVYRVDPLSGQGVFSLLLPSNFNYDGPKGVIIRDGVHLKGHITDADIGRKERSITQELLIKYNVETARDFINDANFLLNFYLENVGFTVSLQNCLFTKPERDIDPRTGQPVSLMSAEERIKIQDEARKLREQKEIEINALRTGTEGLSQYELNRRKQMIIEKLNVLTAHGSKLTEDVMRTGRNPLVLMESSGAKGSKETIAQTVVQVGQQLNQGQIMSEPTSWFRQEDICLEANGYCNGAFATGLAPREAFNHAWAARDGVIVSSTQVSLTGDMQNRITRLTEATVVMPDGTVRNGDTGRIIQGRYVDSFRGDMLFNVNVRGQPTLSFIDMKAIAQDLNREFGF